MIVQYFKIGLNNSWPIVCLIWCFMEYLFKNTPRIIQEGKQHTHIKFTKLKTF